MLLLEERLVYCPLVLIGLRKIFLDRSQTMKKVYVSPAFVINSVIMGVILLISLISLFVFAIMYRIEFIGLAALFGSWCVLSIICILLAFFSKKVLCMQL